MEHKLWAVAVILTPLKTRLDLSIAGQTDGTLGSQKGDALNFTPSIKFTMETHPLVRISGSSLPRDTTRNPFPPMTLSHVQI